jgi:hypothetical protein
VQLSNKVLDCVLAIMIEQEGDGPLGGYVNWAGDPSRSLRRISRHFREGKRFY